MVTRTYPIRIEGCSGPLTNELGWEVIEQRSGLGGLEEKERTSGINRLAVSESLSGICYADLPSITLPLTSP